jgi:predicted aminopeptidase
VRGVDAFSTLGFFRDPLYSYMRDYSVYELADLLIHELFHATAFIKNEVQFNEELAEFVGGKGARLYIERRFGIDSPEFQNIEQRKKESALFAAFIQNIRTELDGVYRQDISAEEKIRRKEEIIARAKNTFSREYTTMFASDNYRYFSDLAVNNAYFQLFALYHENGPYLEDLYTRSGVSLPAFIEAAKKIKGKDNPRELLEKALFVVKDAVAD